MFGEIFVVAMAAVRDPDEDVGAKPTQLHRLMSGPDEGCASAPARMRWRTSHRAPSWPSKRWRH